MKFDTLRVLIPFLFSVLVACVPPGQEQQTSSENLLPPSSQEQNQVLSDQGKACYKELCSDNSSQLNLGVILSQAAVGTQAQKSIFQKEVLPLLNSHNEIEKQYTQKLLNGVEDLLNKNQLPHLEETQIKFIMAILALDKNIEMKNKDILFDLVANEILKEKFITAKKASSVSGSVGYLKTIHGNISTLELIEKETVHLIKRIREINKKLNLNLIQEERIREITEFKKLNQISDYQLKDLVILSAGIRTVYQITNSLEKINVPLLTAEELQQMTQIKFIKNLKTGLNDSLQRKEICEVKFYQDLNTSPSDKEIQKFQFFENEMKNSVIEILPNADFAAEKIKKIETIYPISKNKVSQKWKEYLSTMLVSSKNQLRHLETERSDQFKFMLAILHSLSASKVESACDTFLDLEISDATLVDSGQIRVSWLSVKFPHYGMGIYAHELGHSVEKWSQSYKHQMDCMAEIKPDKKNQSEDFADYISAKALLNYQKKSNIKPQNMGCFLASFGPSGEIKNTQGPHSAGLFRAIHIAELMHLNIPKVCQNVIEENFSVDKLACH